MAETVGIKMAKPSKADQRVVYDFLQWLEGVVENGEYAVGDEEPVPVKDNGEAMLRIEEKWRRVSACWCRVVLAGEVAIDNACDPAADVLEFKPEIKAALAEVERLRAERDALQRFKVWVHSYLDAQGVPATFPDGPHTREGCRIGDRMDWWRNREARLRTAAENTLASLENPLLDTSLFDDVKAELRVALRNGGGA